MDGGCHAVYRYPIHDRGGGAGVAFQEHPRVWERSQPQQPPPSWGRPAGPRPPGQKPLVTYWLLGAMGATFLLQLIVSGYDARGGFVAWRGIGYAWEPFLFTIGTDWMFRPWTLVTSTFAHANPSHLFFNGLFLFFMGPAVERLVGGRRLLAVFLVGGAVSGIAQVHLVAWRVSGSLSDPFVQALGASGALMAIFGVLIALIPKARVFFMVFPVPMWAAGVLYAALDVLGVFNPGDGVGHFAHLAGLALGLGYGYWARGDLRRRGLRIVEG